MSRTRGPSPGQRVEDRQRTDRRLGETEQRFVGLQRQNSRAYTDRITEDLHTQGLKAQVKTEVEDRIKSKT